MYRTRDKWGERMDCKGKRVLLGATLAAMFVAAVLVSPVVQRVHSAPGDSGYKLIQNLPLAGEGGWDYLAIDAEARRLYISRDTGIVVFDVDSQKVVGNIPHTSFAHRGVGFVHGVAIALEFNRGFISHEVPPSVIIFDLKTLAQVGEDKTDPGTDVIIDDSVLQSGGADQVPASGEVFGLRSNPSLFVTKEL